MRSPRITYTIAMPQPHTHLYDVQIEATGLKGTSVDVVLPSWTPGSYMIREYARHVQEFAAETGGESLRWYKIAKDTWRIATGGAAQVQVRYRVYANELTVRTSHLDGSHGYFNGASVFMYIPGRINEPLKLVVEPFPGWRVTTGLDPFATDDDDPTAQFLASDYDELVDCPVECGTQRLLTFEVDEIEHRMAIWGRGNENEQRMVADTKRIVEVQRDLFGGLPYRHYTFILHLTDGRGGGLEHRNSVTNQLNRWSFQPERSYERFLGLQSHEFFHVWNVKRIRVEPLGPFDYRHENYTWQLWAMEGVTSYYDNLFLRRAGLYSPERYLEIVAEDILALQRQPGRNLQSLEQSSFDTWIKLYRPDENSVNSSISYYLKGSLVALMLDLEIRHHTANQYTLDDVLRYLYTTYPSNAPGIPEDGGYLAAVEAVVGEAEGAYRALFASYVAGTAELDYDYAFGHAGLRLEWGYRSRGKNAAPAWLGMTIKHGSSQPVVASTRSDGPAYQAGVYADDELIAMDGMRITAQTFDDRLRERTPGDTVTLTLFRRDELLHVPVTLAKAPHNSLRLVPIAQPNDLQRQIHADWLALA